MKLSRRSWLKLAGLSAVNLPLSIAPTTPPIAQTRLAENIRGVLDGLEIGLDLRRIDPITGWSYFSILNNAEKLYPVASCFKMPLVLYYLLHTPQQAWEIHEHSAAYRTAVVSDNYTTAELLQQVDQRIHVFGNAIEKFNDFLLFTIGLQNGLHRWNWEGSVTEGQVDVRFEPSQGRYISVGGTRYQMDNLFTTTELATCYDRLLNPDHFAEFEQSSVAIEQTLALFSIAARNYQSPIERAFPGGYIGKDGVLPANDSAVGRVINDAGIVQVHSGTYILAYMCVGQGEWLAIQILRQIATFIDEYERFIL